MGIRGLLTLIKDELTFDMIDLVEEAKKNGTIEILVDFHAIVRFITQNFTKKLALDYDNEFVYFPIGVDDMFTDAFFDLHNGFKEAGITMVWILDGPKIINTFTDDEWLIQGVDEVASEQKEETWVTRDKEDVLMMKNVLSACRHKLPLHDLNNLGPIGHFDCALSGLKRAGAEVIFLLQGESDDFIAYEFHRRKSFAIWTNDTDFVIFRECVVIFEQLMSHNYGKDDLKLPFMDYDNPGKIFKRPDTLKLPVIKQEHILKLFKFTSYSQLIALSIIKGNDNTSAYASELQYSLGITKNPGKIPHVTHVAQYIVKEKLTSEQLESLPKMKHFMANYPQLGESIKFCKDLYSLDRIKENLKKKSTVIFDPTTNDDSLTGFLAEKLSKGEIAMKAYSIHFGVVHDAVFPEKPSKSCLPILVLLFEIRRQIYPYLLKDGLTKVTEWRSRSPGDHQIICPVTHATIKTNMIKAKPDEGDCSSSETYGIDIFETVISHLEQNGSPNYVKKYGIEKAFVCYLLRYMYLLTKERNLKLSRNEFRALFVTVFYQFSISKDITFKTRLNRDLFIGMKICPSEQCLIIPTWFMNIFFTAKYLCGAAFNLTEEFPISSRVMCGPVFYAFYEKLCEDNGRINHLEESVITDIGRLEDEIIAMYQDEYGMITE